jgi:two-component system, OmpR family, response regulator RegX3
MAERILIVEDEASVADGVAYTLEQEGFETAIAADGKTALDQFDAWEPDLVVLDLMLPEISGWDLFAAFRRRREVPVIMLTARVEELDRVAGLEMGADDYVTKPFSMRELVARVRAVLRRSAASQAEATQGTIAGAGVRLDTGSHEVMVGDKALELSPKEFDLLAYLMRNAGRVRARQDILAAVWGENEYVDERTVDVHVRWLRKKIESEPGDPQRIVTVRGAGYKFVGGE